MTVADLIADLRGRINPAYAAQAGTESYERRLCVEALEAQAEIIDALRDHLRDEAEVREMMADILSRTAIALRGPEPELTGWSWHDLPERAMAMRAAIEKTLTENGHLADGDNCTLIELVRVMDSINGGAGA